MRGTAGLSQSRGGELAEPMDIQTGQADLGQAALRCAAHDLRHPWVVPAVRLDGGGGPALCLPCIEGGLELWVAGDHQGGAGLALAQPVRGAIIDAPRQSAQVASALPGVAGEGYNAAQVVWQLGLRVIGLLCGPGRQVAAW